MSTHQEGWELYHSGNAWKKMKRFEANRNFPRIRHYRDEPCDIVLQSGANPGDTSPKQLERALGPYSFPTRISTPVTARGGMGKTRFTLYAPSEIPERFDQIVQSWDTANTSHKLKTSYSVSRPGHQEPHLYCSRAGANG